MKDITYNLDEIIEIIKKNTDKNYCVTLKDTNFEFGHLLSLQKRLNENSKILKITDDEVVFTYNLDNDTKKKRLTVKTKNNDIHFELEDIN